MKTKTIGKECNRCLNLKTLDEFPKDKNGLLGRKAKCRVCRKELDVISSRTLDGFVRVSYNGQTSRSATRGYGHPDYSKSELKDWLTKNIVFSKLFQEWESSGYEKDLRPSIDRIDDYAGYTFSNIQLMTFKENREKGDRDRISGANTKQSRAVNKYDMEGNFIEQFHSLASAGRSIGGNYNISSCCSGKHEYIKGFKWRFADEC